MCTGSVCIDICNILRGYACINLDLPDRRMPVMILMSGVPFSSMILSRYFALVIVFISSPAFKSRKFFISWNHFDVLIILSANSICKRPLSKTQNILFFESGYYVKAIRIFGTILGLKNGVSFSRFLYRGTMAPYVYNFSLWWEISLDTGCTDTAIFLLFNCQKQECRSETR